MPMDNDFAEVFGEYDDDTEEKGAEGTESAGEAETGENGQEVTDPAKEGEEGAEEGEEEESGDDHAAEDETKATGKQTPEQRHQQAALRRQREDTARQTAEQARVDKIYADMFAGQEDPFTHKPITTEADYLAYKDAMARQQEQQALEAAGLKPDVLEQMVDRRVSQHPDILKAQAALAAAEAERARAAEQQAREAIGAQMKAIQAVNPAIKGLEDIAAMPTAAVFNQYVQQGLTLEDAYYLANRGQIETQKTAAAKQAAINQTRSKGHLESGAGGASNAVAVPADEAAAYREMMPDATDKEIQAAWEKFQKSLR